MVLCVMVLQNVIGIVALVCAIWVIYDVFENNKRKSTGWKIAWTVFALLLSIVAAIVYYFTNKQ